ncbi:MAG: phosphoribosylanthranilate isomerase [Phormidesmis sp.]
MIQVKICGITSVQQARAIAQAGATALGYICVHSSPRYITPENVAPITAAVTELAPEVEHVGVFADAPPLEIITVTKIAGLSVIQLHGGETPAICQLLQDALTHSDLEKVKLIKAVRVRSPNDLETALSYSTSINGLLLDAYHPKQLGGTGKTLDWQALRAFSPSCPWFLAGGLTPDNVQTALSQLCPDGIDLSSGVERSPGDKDLAKVKRLFEQVKAFEMSAGSCLN